MWFRLAVLATLGLALSVISGCRRGGPLPLKRVAPERLPAIRETFVVEDGEHKLAVPVPDGWKSRPNTRRYLARLVPATASDDLPYISLRAAEDDASDKSWTNVRLDNVEQFAADVQRRLNGEGVRLIESVRPMVIGDRAFARYVRVAQYTRRLPKIETLSVEHQVLETVLQGRRYLVTLAVLPDGILEGEPPRRDASYAVIENLQQEESQGSP